MTDSATPPSRGARIPGPVCASDAAPAASPATPPSLAPSSGPSTAPSAAPRIAAAAPAEISSPTPAPAPRPAASPPALRLLDGGRKDPAPGRRGRRALPPQDETAPNPRLRRTRRRPASAAAKAGPEEIADAALLLLTSVRGPQDARQVIDRLCQELEPEALEEAIEAIALRLALLSRAANGRPRLI